MSSTASRTSCAREGRARAPALRGFTLVELLISIIIIGLLAVMAMPSLSLTSFDRDQYADAGAIMQVFRSARTRAIARGSAVVVQMATDLTYASGQFETYEAVTQNPNNATGSQSPLASCKYPTLWSVGTATMQPIDGFAIGNSPTSVDVLAGIMAQPYVYTAATPTATAFNEGYICYTPLGRSYFFQGAAPPVFTALTSAVTAIEIRVTRTNGATVRSVLLPNNGMARLFSHSS